MVLAMVTRTAYIFKIQACRSSVASLAGRILPCANNLGFRSSSVRPVVMSKKIIGISIVLLLAMRAWGMRLIVGHLIEEAEVIAGGYGGLGASIPSVKYRSLVEG